MRAASAEITSFQFDEDTLDLVVHYEIFSSKKTLIKQKYNVANWLYTDGNWVLIYGGSNGKINDLIKDALEKVSGVRLPLLYAGFF
ncbi:hypothetical protein H7S74_13300 [Priestia aryabhattai]|uniref:hypothetical protein n=1 Tax=Priestia aryabhattai TaxID=412384 RepID=UPI001EB44771|nr:hypothetical protein [Priestia aryabhattai]MBY0091418.1 hypothetical protein [Priestia aryabhattai]MBY0102327.1 hypothetical protein [Priestia aryabhattai]